MSVCVRVCRYDTGKLQPYSSSSSTSTNNASNGDSNSNTYSSTPSTISSTNNGNTNSNSYPETYSSTNSTSSSFVFPIYAMAIIALVVVSMAAAFIYFCFYKKHHAKLRNKFQWKRNKPGTPPSEDIEASVSEPRTTTTTTTTSSSSSIQKDINSDIPLVVNVFQKAGTDVALPPSNQPSAFLVAKDSDLPPAYIQISSNSPSPMVNVPIVMIQYEGESIATIVVRESGETPFTSTERFIRVDGCAELIKEHRANGKWFKVLIGTRLEKVKQISVDDIQDLMKN